ncbi:hypothetical protein JL193_04510 [Polaribacter batillariae]|uniref:Uncharacterized protein n=1 Tax=Polaribacter batillariae TaxID=2808900 RepID=A0ABX7SWC1_9FLAO|nr:hypothetical protein [Polaribacter batillariae]QTD38555.1 hypothetical protein JL193_04510 [Polaribacter batillariae]
MILKKNYLEKLESDQLFDLAEFIVMENFKHHSNQVLPKDYRKDIHSIYNEEIIYCKNSEIFVAKDHLGGMVGAIRVLKWNYIDVLPIQKIFGINPLVATKEIHVHNIYHIGRFAIKKEIGNIYLFKQLMICAIASVCAYKDNIVFAECDSKLVRILSLLGIKTNVIGASINYLGSETIPISMDYNGLIEFYNKNKS